MFDVVKNSDYCACCWFALKTQTSCDKMFLFHSALKETCVGGRTWKILAANICFSIHQMSKSTGNFLTLTQAIDKFSADGAHRFHLIYCPPSLCFLSFTILLSCDFLSIFLSCFIETLEKNTSGAHLEQIKICFHSARAITLDYTISILYPLVKIIRKRPIVIRWLTCW